MPRNLLIAVALFVLAIGLTGSHAIAGLAGPGPWFWGNIYVWGNDTGGIIPWSPLAESEAVDIAQADCGAYGKYAVITSVHRQYGDYIGYVCSWKPVRRQYVRLRR